MSITVKKLKQDKTIPVSYGDLEQLRANQVKLGLGVPSIKAFAKLVNQEEAVELGKDYERIERPTFEKSGGHSVAFTPRIIMAELVPKLEYVVWKINRPTYYGSYQASIPLIPGSIQAFVSKVRERVPAMRFHIVFEPQWVRTKRGVPVADAVIKFLDDPVILGQYGNHWFKIAAWDGDKELIESMIKPLDSKTV